ncbi:MAG: DUF1330 domain-containing protein [Acidobacteria bacterium]|nr:DUF1330 domain-containing protein [Acidobacteriota bacterium]
MPAYVVVTYDIADPEAFAPYAPAVMPLLAKHGAEVLAADFDSQPLEGAPPSVTIVLKFESEESARNWHSDPEYVPVKQIRLNSTKNGNAVLAKGFVMPPG